MNDADGRIKSRMHDGDLADAVERYARPESDWIDLSTGINPNAFPLPQIEPAAWERLESALRVFQGFEGTRRHA